MRRDCRKIVCPSPLAPSACRGRHDRTRNGSIMALPYFAHQGLTLDVVGLPEFITGVERAKILTVRVMRGAFKRGGNQVRRRFIQEQLKGPPGIHGGALAKGKNVFVRAYG